MNNQDNIRSIRSPNPLTACPVLEEAQHVLTLSQDMGKAMRRLRKKISLCRECEKEGDCPALKMFQDQIRAAIDEVSQDWA